MASLLMLKSLISGWPACSRMFAGFRSRWARFFECRVCRPWATCRARVSRSQSERVRVDR